MRYRLLGKLPSPEHQKNLFLLATLGYPTMLNSFYNHVFKRFVVWTTIYVVIWVLLGVTIGCLLNPQLTGTASLTSSQESNLLTSTRTFLMISLVIDGLILIVYCLCRHIRKRDVSFVICLIAADFVNMGARFASSFGLEDEVACRTTGTILAYCSMSTVLWIYILSFYLYHRIVYNVSTSDFGNTKIAFHVFGWGAPVLPALFGLGFNIWGKAGAWCWVGHEHPAFRIFYYYLPMLETFLISAFCFTKIIIKIRSVTNDPNSKLKTSAHIRLTVYLMVFCLFNFWGLAFRISNMVNPKHYIVWLYFIHHSERALSGALDGIVFGYAFWGEIRRLYFTSEASSEMPKSDGGSIQRSAEMTIQANISKATSGSGNISGSV